MKANMMYKWTKEEIVRFFKESGMEAYGHYGVTIVTNVTNDSEMESKVLHELNKQKRIWAAMPTRFPWRDVDGKLTLLFHKGVDGFYYISSLYTNIRIDNETKDVMMMCAAKVAWNNKILKMGPDELIGYMKYKITQAAKKTKQLKMDQIKTCGGDYEV